MAVKTFRVGSGTDAGWGALFETDQTAANRTDGWVSAKLAAANMSEYNAGSKLTSASFSTSVKPGVLSGGTSNAFKSPSFLKGTFAATAWTFTFAMRCGTSSSQRGRMRMRVFKSANANGSSATELTGSTQIGTTVGAALSTTVDQLTTVTWTPGTTITLDFEFLFFVLAWEITTAGGSNSADVLIRTGQSAGGSRLVTPDFTDTSPTFPSVSVVDDFNRPNSTDPGSSWAGSFAPAGFGLQIVNNRLQTVGSAGDRLYWDAPDRVDMEAFVTIAAVGGSGDDCDIEVRRDIVADTGYVLRLEKVSNSALLYRKVAGAETLIGSYPVTIAAGDAFGISVYGSQIIIWEKPSGGSWGLVYVRTDTTITAAGKAALAVSNATWQFDDWGAHPASTPVSGGSDGGGITSEVASAALKFTSSDSFNSSAFLKEYPTKVHTNSAEGGTQDAALTSGSGGNTGGTSGDFFDTTFIAGTLIFDAASATHGSMGIKATSTGGGQATYVSWTKLNRLMTTHGRAYMRFPALPPADAPIIRLSRIVPSVDYAHVYLNMAGKLEIRDSAKAVKATSGMTLSTNTWYGISYRCRRSSVGGEMRVRIYALDAFSPLEEFAASFDTTDLDPTWDDQAAFGIVANGPWSFVVQMDSLVAGRFDWPVPIATPPQEVNGADSGAISETASSIAVLSSSDLSTISEQTSLVTPPLQVNSSDSGAVAESASVVAQISTSEVTGPETEVASITKLTVSSSDVTGPETEVATANAQLSSTDSGTVSDVAALGAQTLQSADTATISEAQSVVVKHTVTDTATAADSATLVARPSSSDSGAVAESATRNALLIASDTGTTTETLNVGILTVEGGGGPAAPTLPVTSGLGLWLDASVLPLGSIGSQWNDLSGAGKHGAVVGTPSPTVVAEATLFDRNVVRFSSSEGRIRGDHGITTPYTIVYLVRRVGISSPGRAYSGQYPAGGNYLLGFHSSQRDWIYDNNHNNPNPTPWEVPPSPWMMYSGSRDAAGMTEFYVNGAYWWQATGGSGLGGLYALSGYDATGTNETMDFQLAEIVVYNRALSAVERQSVENYLSDKWLEAPVAGGGPFVTVVETAAISLALVSSDAGSASEAASISVNLSSTDSGALSAETLANRVAVADNATATETASPAVPVASSDVSGPVTEAVSLAAKPTGVDTGSLSETAANTRTILSSTDTATVVDTASTATTTPKSGTDAGTTSETASVRFITQSSDSGTFSDAQSLVARPSVTDSGTTTEIGSLSGQSLQSSDAGSSSEVIAKVGILTVEPDVAAAPFDPNSVAGLSAWYDASQLALSDNAPVLTWPDESPAGKNLTQMYIGAPTFKTNVLNGKPVVRFSGDSQTLSTSATMTMLHWFVVARFRQATFPTYNGLLTGPGGNDLYLIGTLGTATFYHHAISSYEYRMDGVTYEPPWPAPMNNVFGNISLGRGLTTTVPLQVGQDRDQTDRWWDGDVAEIVVYDHVLSSVERQQVESYLNSKWLQPAAPTSFPTVTETTTISFTSSDVATTSETASITKKLLTVSDAGSISETQSLSTQNLKSDADSATLAAEGTSLVARPTPSGDSGSSAESASARVFVPPSVDTATAAEIFALVARLTVSDLGAVSESFTPRVVVVSLDSGTLIDNAIPAKYIGDVALGIDSEFLHAWVEDQDFGTMTEAFDRQPPLTLFTGIPAGVILAMSMGTFSTPASGTFRRGSGTQGTFGKPTTGRILK